MKIGGAALNQTPLDWEGNRLRIESAIEAARKNEIELLCLTELCITGYGCEDMFLHPWVSEKSLEILEQIIQKTQNIGVIIGLPLLMKKKIYNALVFVENSEIKGVYCKQHLPKDGIHYEYRWFESWPVSKIDEIDIFGEKYLIGHITVEFKEKTLGFEICEDAWVADRPCLFSPKKPDIILNPSASHFAFGKSQRRQEIIRSSSAIFQCVYVYANQLGNEAGRIIYDGDIMVAQQGQLLATAKRLSFADYSLHSVEVDFENPKNSEVRINDELIEKNEEFPQVVSLALFDYLRKSVADGFVLSLSGGADSSIIVVMVAEMVKRGIMELGNIPFCLKLGRNENSIPSLMKNLLTVAYQGTVNSSDDTFNSAKALAESVGATFFQWEIDDQVCGAQTKIEKAIGRELSWKTDDITLQNIQARSRSPLIWMLANIKNALLLATSNRSEGSVGYTTMDGDTSGSLSPIAGIDKSFICDWLKYAEKEMGYTALKYTNDLSPSAELRPIEETQTDEEDLMPYDLLVLIERLFVYERRSKEEIIKNLTKKYDRDRINEWVEKYFQLWKRNQWKRERFATSFHLDDYNIDPRSWFRYPVLSGK